MTNSGYAKLTAGLIAAWFSFSLAASAAGWFKAEPNRPPLPLLLAVVIPITVFAVWYRSAASFREFVLGLSPVTLTQVQAWRIVGFVFLVMYAYRLLPGEFALPAGWGDMLIGATALVAASRLAKPNHRAGFIAWQLLGMTDLVVALGSGAAGQLLSAGKSVGSDAISTAPMTVLPLSLIPTFAVPLLFLLHVICIAQARRWAGHEVGHAGTELHSAAV
jgi:hypothetical protein